jgi:hypothetical protein
MPPNMPRAIFAPFGPLEWAVAGGVLVAAGRAEVEDVLEAWELLDRIVDELFWEDVEEEVEEDEDDAEEEEDDVEDKVVDNVLEEDDDEELDVGVEEEDLVVRVF